MVTQGKGNDNDDAGDLSTKQNTRDFIHDDNDIEDNIDELYTNAFAFHKFEHVDSKS